VEPEFYERYAQLERTHWWFRGRRTIVLGLLADRLEGSPLDVLDFGCGTGGMLDGLGRFGHVVGVDADVRAVELSRSRGHDVRHIVGDASLPFDDGSFDAVTALDVLEHLREDVAALRELRRVLRPSGVLLATVPAFQSLWGDQDVVSHHFRRYRAPQLASRLRDAGFEVERTTYFNTLLFPPIAAIRVGRRLWRRPRAAQSDFELGSNRFDGVLARVFRCEAPILARRSLPFGVSALAIAHRT